MAKKILVISWFYPPVNSSEGLVTYKLLKNSKYAYDVFTQKDNASWSYSNTDILPESSNVHSIYASSTTLDSWVEEAIQFFKNNIDKYDIVMTRSMPPESHKIGLALKSIKPSIKWIASFGDPIAENPYTKLVTSYESPYRKSVCRNILGVISPKRIFKNSLFKLKHKKMQKKYFRTDFKLQKSVFEKSDYIIFNSSYQQNYMCSLYKNDYTKKSIIFNHSYDPTLYPQKSIKNTNKIEFNYIGHLDTIRSPFLFLDALKDLYAEDPELPSKISVNFYGTMSDIDKLFIINNELYDIVKIKKPVSYLQSLSIMKNSDWLLQIDGNISSVIENNIFFAAKLADYIGSGSKIFGITMCSGISADIMRNLNCVCLSYSKNEIKNYLWLIINNGFSITLNKNYQKEFSNIEVAKQFDKLIDSIK